ncbi:hypothetical protein H9P43_005871 [Blastocladiella emersonii ATCC 22665]|nr:hypothetical protein H9P43_005871 [Blastocladiella emersonii ATCC 22665]
MFSITDLPKGTAFGPAASEACYPYDMPYQPFNKQEKLGRVADWLGTEELSGRPGHQQQRGGPQGQQQRGGAKGGRGGDRQGAEGTASAFGFQQEYDEASFSTVNSTGRTAAAIGPTPTIVRGAPTGRGGAGFGGRGGSAQRGGRGGASNVGGRPAGGEQRRGPGGAPSQGGYQGGARQQGGQGGRGGYRGNFQQRIVRDASLAIGADWSVVTEFELPRLAKTLAVPEVPDNEVLDMNGSIATYTKSFDRVNTKNPVQLATSDRSNLKSSNVTTSEDPVILDLIAEGPAKPTVYATDAILSQIMAAPRSVYSWDLVITRIGDNVVLLDRRAGALDLLSVNENAHEPPADHPTDKDFINNPGNLAIEATYINANFSQQVVDHAKRVNFGAASPLANGADADAVPSAGYMYRKWSFEDRFDVVARTEIDAVAEEAGGKQVMLTVRAFNQVPGLAGQTIDWKKQYDSKRGAIQATEMRNNGFKVARWTMQALLAEADWMKIGYVARVAARDPAHHVVVGSTTFRPADMAAQMNITLAQGWALVGAIAEAALEQDPGKYVLLKDPNKPNLRIYALPDNFGPEFIVGPNDPFADAVGMDDEDM